MRVRGSYFELRILIVCLTGFFGFSEVVALARVGGQQAEYFSYVNWDYGHRNDLIGWKHTSELIHASLIEWGYATQKKSLENTPLRGLLDFQQLILSPSSPDLKLIYLASHQTPSGRIDFPDQAKAFWSEGLMVPKSLTSSPSIFLLDVCHAAVIPEVRMNGQIPFGYLLTASTAKEETYELRMFARRPVDFRRRYPAEVQWMKAQLGDDWKGEVSFTGFIWVRQFLKSPHPPQSLLEWGEFLSGMEQEASLFAKERSRYLASTIQVWE